MQPQGQRGHGAQPPAGGARPVGQQPRADVAPVGQRDRTRERRGSQQHRQRQHPPALVTVRAQLRRPPERRQPADPARGQVSHGPQDVAGPEHQRDQAARGAGARGELAAQRGDPGAGQAETGPGEAEGQRAAGVEPGGSVAERGQQAGHHGRQDGLGHGRREQRVPADDRAREELRASGLLLQPGVPADQDAAEHGHEDAAEQQQLERGQGPHRGDVGERPVDRDHGGVVVDAGGRLGPGGRVGVEVDGRLHRRHRAQHQCRHPDRQQHAVATQRQPQQPWSTDQRLSFRDPRRSGSAASGLLGWSSRVAGVR